jgi:hypothetical protein
MFFICISIFGHELKCSGLKPLPEMVLQKKKSPVGAKAMPWVAACS